MTCIGGPYRGKDLWTIKSAPLHGDMIRCTYKTRHSQLGDFRLSDLEPCVPEAIGGQFVCVRRRGENFGVCGKSVRDSSNPNASKLRVVLDNRKTLDISRSDLVVIKK